MAPPDPWRRDRRLLCASAFLRATATALLGVRLGLELARRGLDEGAIGVVVSAGLAGAAAASLAVTLRADRLGRRRTLVVLALLGALGALTVPASTGVAFVAGAAFLGMLNGMGRDRGAALVLEQAALPETTTDARRTRVFAAYNVLQDAGHALGSLLAALPAARSPFGLYAALLLATVVLSAALTPAVERRAAPAAAVTPATRKILWKVGALFALDSLGGGFLTAALLTVFFRERFGASDATLAALFAGARVANAASHWLAAVLAGRFGLVNTMVFTHLPSSLLLATVPFAPDLATASVLFLLREGLVEMDVPTRQSYVMAIVRPEERTLASGVTHLVRMAAWAVAPVLAGVTMREGALFAPLLVAAVLKIAYDVLLYRAFIGLKPPEERG